MGLVAGPGCDALDGSRALPGEEVPPPPARAGMGMQKDSGAEPRLSQPPFPLPLVLHLWVTVFLSGVWPQEPPDR